MKKVEIIFALLGILSLIFTPTINDSFANSIVTDNPSYIVNQVKLGLVASDPLNDQILTKAQLSSEGGYWGFGGSAASQGFPVDFNEDSQGLHIGAQSLTPATWGGVFALSPPSDANLIHATISAPASTIPNDWFQTGMYIQSTNGKINYVTCVASLGPWGLSWHLVRAYSDATNPFLYEILWSDLSPNQPTTRDCTLVTNGDNYLKFILDNVTVYESSTLALGMPGPWIYFLEVENSQADAMLYGTYNNFYAAKADIIDVEVASYLPLGDFGKVELLDASANVLASSPFVAGKATIPVGQHAFPIVGQLKVYDPADSVIFTSSSTNLAGGDVYSIELPSVPGSEILPITRYSSGLVVADMDTQPNTKAELLAMAQPNGYWYYDGSSNEQQIEWQMWRDANGLDLGVKAQSSGFYAGIFQQSPGIPAALFHSTINTPYDKIPSDWFQNGIYVQDGPNELINYIACISITGTQGTVWAVGWATGNMDLITKVETLWVDQRYNQPQTRECTIITNGDNYLKVYLDREAVYEIDNHPGFGMSPPFLYFHEPQSSYPGDFLHGKYYDFYATKSENVRVFGIPSTQYGTVKLFDALGNVLESAPIIGTEANLMIGKYHFPLAAEIKVYEKNVEIASTPIPQQMYGGDEYTVNYTPVLDPIGDKSVNEGTLLTFTATASDADVPAQPLTFSLQGAPVGALIDPVTGVFSWTPPENQPNVSLTVQVSDGHVSDSETINVAIQQVENPPIATDDEARTPMNVATTINVLGNDIDPEGLPLSSPVLTSGPTSGVASVNPDGTILYTPNTDFAGRDTIVYEITDAAGLVDTGTLTITATTIKTQLVKMIIPANSLSVSATAPANFEPVNPDNTIVLISGVTQHSMGWPQSVDQTPIQTSARVDLVDGSTITASRSSNTVAQSDEVWVSIIEYQGPSGGPDEFIVRDRTDKQWVSGSTSTSYGPISSVVDVGDVVVFNNGAVNPNTGASHFDRGDVRAYIDGSKTVRLVRGDGVGAINSGHQVVEFIGSNWSIQTGATVPSPHIPAQGPEAGGTDVTVNDVGVISDAWIYFNWNVNSANLDERGHRVWLISDTNLRVQEHATATASKMVQWYIISNPDQKVQTLAADDQFKNLLKASAPVAEPVTNIKNAIAWVHGMTDGGGNAHPRDMWQFELQDKSTINLERHRSGQNLDYRAFVIEFP